MKSITFEEIVIFILMRLKPGKSCEIHRHRFNFFTLGFGLVLCGHYSQKGISSEVVKQADS